MRLRSWVMNPLANLSLWASSWPGHWAWTKSSNNVQAAQQKVLMETLRRNANTRYGKQHGFNYISSPSEFQTRLPLCTYPDLHSLIGDMADGETNVLTADGLRMFEVSSGSTSASKLIPYTNLLKAQFQCGLDPWIYSMYRAWPKLLTGKQYWSVTPIGSAKRHTARGVPIGFDEDSEYFGGLKRLLIRQLFAVPPEISKIQDQETFRYATLRFLIQAEDLAFISVWHPTFLTLLLDRLDQWLPALAEDLRKGTLTPPKPLDATTLASLKPFLKRDDERSWQLVMHHRFFKTSAKYALPDSPTIYEYIWPRLTLVSCWADGNSTDATTQLKRRLPHVAIQPKGLLATEGIVSFPYGKADGHTLSLNSHFYEFIPVGTTAQPLLAHQLERSGRYEVILTTGGGLYRYRLQDEVEVVGFHGNCPLIRFLGKLDGIVDLCGEKLNESHVKTAVEQALRRLNVSTEFWMMAPEARGSCSRYILYLKPQQSADALSEQLQQLRQLIEEELQNNFHYSYCRELGQLAPLELFIIDGNNADELYLQQCVARGQRLGNIKPTRLHKYQDWSAVFPGFYFPNRLRI